ncbi:MAG: S1 RNA-binding domain-containing protein [Erysipelotrichaceae bacterium]|nr:S1 RNA-binding domain-containing protein [Erysipelotrichaceae bacterium]
MQYKIGDIIEGTVTGIQPYGAFVALENHVNGLIHISEISDGFVRDVGHYVQVNDRVRVKVIDIDVKANQVRLSLKAVKNNRFRRERQARKYGSLPEMELGFSSIEKMLPQWIEEAKQHL